MAKNLNGLGQHFLVSNILKEKGLQKLIQLITFHNKAKQGISLENPLPGWKINSSEVPYPPIKRSKFTFIDQLADIGETPHATKFRRKMPLVK
ncbi:MAG: hypothetical protein R3B95_17880 [Nitrospirales bacterium]|nr:hypothetical protein [Nitrospirales bacterium]